jgi:hypothetical protein
MSADRFNRRRFMLSFALGGQATAERIAASVRFK